MACGHCRRPRKTLILQIRSTCWIRGLSSSPKSQGGTENGASRVEHGTRIGSWDRKNSPGHPEALPGRALALPAPRKAPGSVRAAADCTPPGGRPGGPSVGSGSQPTSPPTPLLLLLLVLPLFSPRPHTPRRGRRIRDGLRPLPPTPKRNLGFQLRSTLLGPRLVELSEEPRWVESNASRVENGTRNRFLGCQKLSWPP